MMTNLLHGAHVANKLFSTIARLRLLLVMFLTLTVTTNAWGADVILWNGSNPSYQASTTEKTSTDGAIKWVNSAENTYSNPTRIYSGNTLTISVANTATTKITKIVAVCTTDAYASAFGGTSVNVTGGGTANRSVSSSTTTITITGKATSVAMKMSAQSRVSKLTVTYETAAATKYTVTLNAGPGTCAASVTEASAGAGVTLPTPTLDCGDWEFAGWKTTSAVTTETTTEPTLIAAGAYSPTSDITLYAVYQRTEESAGGGSTEEEVIFSEEGYANQQEVSSYNGTNFSVAFDKGNNSNTPKYYTSGTAIRIYGGGYFTVSSDATITKIVLGFGSSDGSNAITTNVNTYSNGTWTGSAKSVKFTIGGSTGNRRIASLTVTTSGGGSTTYYHSTPDCGSAEPTHYLLRK